MTARTRVATAVVAVAALGAAAGLAVAASGDGDRGHGQGPSMPQPTRKVSTGPFGRSIMVRQVDRRRGLVFELESSPVLGDSGLTVKLTKDAPRATRAAIVTRPLAATCAVPGQRVHEFAGRWDRRFASFGTALYTDDQSVVIADAATSCALYVGREGSTPDIASFDGPAFSRVRMK